MYQQTKALLGRASRQDSGGGRAGGWAGAAGRGGGGKGAGGVAQEERVLTLLNSYRVRLGAL